MLNSDYMIIRNLLLLACVSIHAFEITGLKSISKSAIEEIIGNDTDPNGIRIKLSDSELFTTIQVQQKADNLHIKVEEAPIISKINWDGCKVIKGAQLETLTHIKVGKRLTKQLKEKLRSKIVNVFAAKNMLVSCVISTKPLGQGIELTININENLQNEISSMSIEGLNKLSARKLITQVKPSKTGFFSSSYELPLLEIYKTAINSYARSLGYYEFKITGHSLKQNGNKYSLILLAHEGEIYRLNKITVKSEIAQDINVPRILSKLDLKKGKELSTKAVEEAVKEITIKYEELGYHIRANAEYDILPEHKGNVTIKVVEVEPIIIKDIKVEGNKTSNRDMIIRVSGIAPGNTISQHSFNTAKNNLERTGFFKKVDLETVDINNHTGILKIKTEETPTIKLSLGLKLGYGVTPFTKNISEPELFWGVEAGYITPNFLGEGYTINANAAWISSTQMLDMSFGQSSTVNSRNIGWSVRGGLMRTESGVLYQHRANEENTYIEGKSPKIDSTQQYYLLPDFIEPSKTQNNPRRFDIDWLKYKAHFGFGFSFNVTPWLSVGLHPDLSYQNIDFENDEKNKNAIQTLPRIYDENMFLKEYVNPSIQLPILFNFTELAPRGRHLGFKASIVPTIDRFNAACNFNASYNWALDRDYLSAFSIKFSAGLQRPVNDEVYWEENYKTNKLITGIASWGAKELTSMTSLGGREYLVAQAKLVLPVPYLDEFVRAYGFIAAGTIGNSGIESQNISNEKADLMHIKRGLKDIVNDEHSLRLTTGAGLMWFMGEQTIISVGYNHIFHANHFDRQQIFYLSMDTSIDNA